jgi:hypothetical protein
MAASEHLGMVRRMSRVVDEQIAEVRRRGEDRFTVQLGAVLVGARGGQWVYECELPSPSSVAEDTLVAVSAARQHVTGRVVQVDGRRCRFAVDQNLGREISGWLAVDGLDVLETLRARLTELITQGHTASESSPFHFEQAALALVGPGGPLDDSIAEGAASADTWSLHDRQADLIRTALRYRHAVVQAPPPEEIVGFLARLVGRLLDHDATVLLVGASAALVDHTTLAVCSDLAVRGRLRSGVVQRLGPIALDELHRGFGPLVDAEEIAADLRHGLDQRLAVLAHEELLLRQRAAEDRCADVQRLYSDVVARLDESGARRGLQRLRSGENRSELVVALHKLRAQLTAARAERDLLTAQVAASAAELGRPVDDSPTSAADPRQAEADWITGLRIGGAKEIATVREQLESAYAEIRTTLQRRCRLAAGTAGRAVVGSLPRTTYDAVLIVGDLDEALTYYLAGMAGGRVIQAVYGAQPARAAAQSPTPAPPTTRSPQPTVEGPTSPEPAAQEPAAPEPTTPAKPSSPVRPNPWLAGRRRRRRRSTQRSLF